MPQIAGWLEAGGTSRDASSCRMPQAAGWLEAGGNLVETSTRAVDA